MRVSRWRHRTSPTTQPRRNGHEESLHALDVRSRKAQNRMPAGCGTTRVLGAVNVASQRAGFGTMAQERFVPTQSLSVGPERREASSDVRFRDAGRDPRPIRPSPPPRAAL